MVIVTTREPWRKINNSIHSSVITFLNFKYLILRCTCIIPHMDEAQHHSDMYEIHVVRQVTIK